MWHIAVWPTRHLIHHSGLCFSNVPVLPENSKFHELVGLMQFVVFENLHVLISSKLHEKNHVITY